MKKINLITLIFIIVFSSCTIEHRQMGNNVEATITTYIWGETQISLCKDNQKNDILKLDNIEDFADGTAIVHSSNGYGIIDLNLEYVFGPSRKDTIISKFSSKFKNLLLLKHGNRYGVITRKGTKVLPAEYSKIDKYNDTLMLVYKGKFLGLNKITGEEILECAYTDIKPFHSELNRCLIKNAHDKWGVLDSNFHVITPCVISDEINFDSPQAVQTTDGKYQIFTTEGELKTTEYEFEVVGAVGADIIPIRRNGKCGYAMANGEVMVPCIYDKVLPVYSQEMIRVKKDGYWGVGRIGDDPNNIICKYSEISEPYTINYDGIVTTIIHGKHGNKWDAITNHSEIQTISFECEQIGRITKAGTINVKNHGKWSVKAVEDGSDVFTETFDNVKDLALAEPSDKKWGQYGNTFLLPALKEGLWYYYKHNTSQVFGPYKNVTSFYGGEGSWIQRNGWAGIQDDDGLWSIVLYSYPKGICVISEKYDEIIMGEFDEIPVKKNKLWNWFSLREKGVISEKWYKKVRPLKFGYGAFLNDNNKWGFVDQYGKIIIDPQYDEITDMDSHKQCIVKLNGGYGVISISGDYLLSCKYKKIERNGETYTAWGDDGIKCYSEDGFSQVYPIHYSRISNFNQGLAVGTYAVERGERYAYINENGEYKYGPFYRASSFDESGTAKVYNDYTHYVCIDIDGHNIAGTEGEDQSYSSSDKSSDTYFEYYNKLERRSRQQLYEHADRTHKQVMRHVGRMTQGMP